MWKLTGDTSETITAKTV